MTWTTPPTFVNGELAADQLNIVRDCLDDIDTRLRLHGITSDSSIGAVKTAITSCRLYRNATQTISTGSGTTVTFNGATSDSDSFFNGGSPSRITIPSDFDGDYRVSWGIKYEANATGDRWGWLQVNGSASLEAARRQLRATAAGNTVIGGADNWYGVTAADYVTLGALQTSGGALDVEEAYLMVERIGA